MPIKHFKNVFAKMKRLHSFSTLKVPCLLIHYESYLKMVRLFEDIHYTVHCSENNIYCSDCWAAQS